MYSLQTYSFRLPFLYLSLLCVNVIKAQPAADAGSLIAVVYDDGDNYLCPHSRECACIYLFDCLDNITADLWH